MFNRNVGWSRFRHHAARRLPWRAREDLRTPAIGSGTKLAIGDAIALTDNLHRHGEIKPAPVAYSRERQAAILTSQIAARLSAQ